MGIRNAVTADVPNLVELGREMHQESPRFSRLSFDGDKVAMLFCSLIEGDHGFVMVAERGGQIIGGMAAYIAAHWFSQDLVATDLALFVSPDARGGACVPRLVDAYSTWATDRGASMIQLGISTGVQVTDTERLYTRLGLSRFGSLFEVI